MAVDDIRERMRVQLEETFGVDGAAYLMDRPPGGWSDLTTRHDLAALEARVGVRFTEVDRSLDLKLAAFESRLDAKIDGVRVSVDGLDTEVGRRISDAFAKQTRWLVTTLIASLGVLGGVMIAAIRL